MDLTAEKAKFSEGKSYRGLDETQWSGYTASMLRVLLPTSTILGVEVDADLDHLEREEAEQLARKLKPVQKRKFLALYGNDEPEPEPHSKRQRSEMSPSVKQAGTLQVCPIFVHALCHHGRQPAHGVSSAMCCCVLMLLCACLLYTSPSPRD